MPAKIAVKLKSDSVFDFGCGHGDDLRFFKSRGIKADGSDPYWRRCRPEIKNACLITCFYVLCCILKSERKPVLRKIRNAMNTKSVALIAVRAKTMVDIDAKLYRWRKTEDGYITKRRTLVYGFSLDELRSLLGESGLVSIKTMYHDGNSIVVLARRA